MPAGIQSTFEAGFQREPTSESGRANLNNCSAKDGKYLVGPHRGGVEIKVDRTFPLTERLSRSTIAEHTKPPIAKVVGGRTTDGTDDWSQSVSEKRYLGQTREIHLVMSSTSASVRPSVSPRKSRCTKEKSKGTGRDQPDQLHFYLTNTLSLSLSLSLSNR